MENMDGVLEISNILNNCCAYSVDDFNNKVKSDKVNKFSTFFLNIDGNATNFDQLVTKLKAYEHQFSVISLSETNIDQCNQSMYQIDGYQSVYQSKITNKFKWSGVVMYIHETYCFVEIPKVPYCTPNIETLCVTITNIKAPLTIGVVYRAPSGNVKTFNEEFERIISQLPNKNVYITGDFNINLHKADNNSALFEETFISHGYRPLISHVTHEMPQCEKTCIDNIFCNTFENITCSGTITDKLSHHLPIFSFSTIGCDPKNNMVCF